MRIVVDGIDFFDGRRRSADGGAQVTSVVGHRCQL
jgi:hypothetical protein